MTTITAQAVLRSCNASAPGKVLSTLLLRYPRFIHAELMTHRAFSRNAASSRAIPVSKMIDDILADTAMPFHWGKNQKGMQASEECNALLDLYEEQQGPDERESDFYEFTREEAWSKARDKAVEIASAFADAGYHKQVVNRLLEPFMHITVLVSATEWDNFLELRDHSDAEPHIANLARAVRSQISDDINPPQMLSPGQWHLPFVAQEDRIILPHLQFGAPTNMVDVSNVDDLIKLSVAGCASTSYKTVDGFDMTLDRAVELHDKLVGSRPIHASPCEHVAQVDEWDSYENGGGEWLHPGQHANFVGFRQYRHMLKQESES